MNKKNTTSIRKIWLASPTMHENELLYVNNAFEKNWVSTFGDNIDSVEKSSCYYCDTKYAVGLCNCTSALHLCIKYAGEKIYGKPLTGVGSLCGKRVFCSDMTFSATINPVLYEGGLPIFIDTDINTWSMDPDCLNKAFELYPDVKIVVYAELYGFPGNVQLIKDICKKHGAILIEDSAEALGASFSNKKCGSFGDYSAISFNGNKIITGSSGGCLITSDEECAKKARKWSTQSREHALWYQHEETGYNYRMSNIIAAIIRGQFEHLDEHIRLKKEIYDRYRKGLKGLPVKLNPITPKSKPNFWLSALIIDKDRMCKQVINDFDYAYCKEDGKTCPLEILEELSKINAEGRPIWKPMHLQPIFRNNPFINKKGFCRAKTNAYSNETYDDVGADIFSRGVCLPSDIKMTPEEQDKIISVIRKCFEK